MSNGFFSDSVLYYPTIEFQDETWVKATLTFWDKIYRIVPPHYKPKDSDEVKIAISNGFIENISLSDEDLSNTANNFEKLCSKLDWFPAGFDSSTYEVKLHSDKIDDRLKPFFREISSQYDNQGFYKIPKEISNGYMFYLSDTVSKRRNISKLTDNRDMFAGMMYFDGEGNYDELFYDYEASELYTNLMIENLLPADIRSIKIDAILDISLKLKNYKADFRKIVAEFSNELSKISDKEFALKAIEKFKKTLTENQITRQEMMKEFFKNLVPSMIYVGIPTLIATLVGSVYATKESIFNLANITSSASIAGVASFANAGKSVRKKWNSNRSNYYLDIIKKLDSVENAKIPKYDMSKLLNEYIND